MKRIVYKYMTAAHKEFFDKKGYAVFKGYMNQSQCKNAIQRIDQIIEQKTQNELKQKFFLDVTEKQLIDSATTVQLFYQKQSHKDGKFIRDKKKCVNKIAHNLHELQTVFRNITFAPKAIDILKALGFIKPAVTQSMAILKVPYDGAPVSIHQDSTYLITEPDTLLAFWIPLEKCTVQNGCLQGVADKRQTVLYEQIRHNKKTELAKPPNWQTKQWQKIEMDPGDLVIFDGKFVHKSGINRSNKSRYAYTWHLFDSGKSKWVEGNWIPNRNFLTYY